MMPSCAKNIGKLFSTCSLNGCIYILGGRQDYLGKPFAKKFNPVTQTWRNIAKMDNHRCSAGKIVLMFNLILNTTSNLYLFID